MNLGMVLTFLYFFLGTWLLGLRIGPVSGVQMVSWEFFALGTLLTFLLHYFLGRQIWIGFRSVLIWIKFRSDQIKSRSDFYNFRSDWIWTKSDLIWSIQNTNRR